MKKLENKVAVVTGGAMGNGLGIAKVFLKYGAKVYIYDNGFIHAKTIVIDEEISSVGTANIDVRSFRLNFEVTAFLYSAKLSKQLVEAFEHDLTLSYLLTLEKYNKRSSYIRFKESISRLLSPIL